MVKGCQRRKLKCVLACTLVIMRVSCDVGSCNRLHALTYDPFSNCRVGANTDVNAHLHQTQSAILVHDDSCSGRFLCNKSAKQVLSRHAGVDILQTPAFKFKCRSLCTSHSYKEGKSGSRACRNTRSQTSYFLTSHPAPELNCKKCMSKRVLLVRYPTTKPLWLSPKLTRFVDSNCIFR